MGVLIKRTGGVQKIKDLKAHLGYIGFRSREKDDEKKGFFNREVDNANFKEFVTRIETNRALKHPKSIKAHKLVFSLKQKDYEAYLKSGKDYKDLIRATLKEYEEKHGIKLDWIASIHDAEGHPHAHVVIKAVSDEKDKEGKYKRIFFKKEDFKEMKDIFNKEFEKEVEYKEYEKLTKDEKQFNSMLLDIGKGFELVGRQIQRDVEKEQFKKEVKKRKDIRKAINKQKREKERER